MFHADFTVTFYFNFDFALIEFKDRARLFEQNNALAVVAVVATLAEPRRHERGLTVAGRSRQDWAG